MSVLLLCPYPERLMPAFADSGTAVQVRTDAISVADLESDRPDMVVSYGYTHIIRQNVIDCMAGRIVNLHIALLPWNRGANPNFWSALENTPPGVSIHAIDAGVDTGPILAQRPVTFSPDETTFTTTQNRLYQEIEDLFRQVWPQLLAGRITPRAQVGQGTLHRKRDLDAYAHLLSDGWDTPIEVVRDHGRRHGLFKA